MAYYARSGDIISLADEKAGALTYSVDLLNYIGTTDPVALWRDQAAVRTVVGAIAADIASIPFHVYRMGKNGDRERVRDSKLARTLAQPIPKRGQARWIEQLVLDMAIFDRWAVRIIDGEDRATLGHVAANYVTVLTDFFGVPEKIHLARDTDDQPVTLDVENFAFDIGPAALPGRRRTGSPRLTTLAGLADELELAAEWRNKVLQNGAWVPAVIERPLEASEWDDDSFNRFRESFSNYRANGGQAGGVPILEDGMQLKKAEVFDPKDFDTAEMRQITLIEACLLFHYPPELIGARPGTYSNVEAFREQKYRDTLGSWITNIEQALNAGLEGLADDGEFIEANVDAKLRGAFAEQAKILQTSTGRPWMTTNEARRLRNLPEIDGGDDLVTPLNVTIGGLASPTDTAPEDGEGDPPKARTPRRKAARPDDLGTAAKEREAFGKALEAFAAEQNERIRKQLSGKAAPSDIFEAVDRTAEADKLKPIILRHLYRLAQVGAWDVLAQYDPEADGWSAENLLAYLDKAAETNAARMANGRVEQLASSDNLERFDDRLSAALKATGWAAAWAVTFGTEALNFGKSDAANSAGLGNKTWRVRSTDPRPSHAAQDGQTVRADDIFANGLRWPGDHFGNAEETVNCTCEIEYSK